MLKDLKIKWKLLLGFGLIIFFTVALSIISYFQLSRIETSYSRVLDGAVVRAQSITEAGWYFAGMRRIATAIALHSGDIQALDSLKSDFDAQNDKLNSVFNTYFEALTNDKLLSADVIEYRKDKAEAAYAMINGEYVDIINGILRLSLSGDSDGALNDLKYGIELAVEVEEIIHELIDAANGTKSEQHSLTTENAKMSKTFMIIISMISNLLAVFFAMIIANILTKSVVSIAAAANKISEGDFNVLVGSGNKDEIANLSNTLLRVKETIEKLVYDINHLSEKFMHGDIEARIDESPYKGEFQSVVREINGTVEGLVNDTLESINVVTEFGKGNFNVEIKQLPGKKEIMTTSFKSVQENLINFNSAIGDIIQGATDGNLDISIDISQYKGDWGKMAAGINGLLASVIEPVREVIDVLNQLSVGNLSISVDGSYKGEFAKVKSTLNSTLAMLSSFIEEMSDVLGGMSNQNLTKTISREYVGDFMEMQRSINSIVKTFNRLLGTINSAAEQVAVGARQMSEASINLAQGTTEQAGSIDELNATVEEITDQTLNNAQNADHANVLAQSVKENAENGNKEMETMLVAMKGINKSSANIAKIIKVIDDIAFQTNLLAINAAVEAARAGEHGKGFAVVAAEVRELASRSQNAAKETSSLIEDSIAKTVEGLQISNQTAQTLANIVSEIGSMSVLIDKVAQASELQSDAVGKINFNLNQISAVTQTNSATGEEQACASQELASQAEVLKSMVDKFKLSSDAESR